MMQKILAILFIAIFSTLAQSEIVSWVHIGDLHITTADQQNYADFQKLITEVNQHLSGGVHFAFLPGDNADDGSEPEYQLIQKALQALKVPLFVVPGDHDAQSGSLSLFQQYLNKNPHQATSIGSYHLIFINALDKKEGSDLGFGIGQEQRAWVASEFELASQKKLTPILFMHSFPDELNDPQLLDVIRKNRVALVEVGHTHYNAIANDGHTIYAATRSTGQVEEGPVGFSITNLDGSVFSWKFKPIGGWPFVMITSPSDKRFVIDPADPNQIIRGTMDVRAKVWGDGVDSISYQIDQSEAVPMRKVSANVWSASWDSTKVVTGDHYLKVTAKSKDGEVHDRILISVNQDGAYIPAERAAGAANNSVGIDSEKGLLPLVERHGPPPGKGPHAHPKDPNEPED